MNISKIDKINDILYKVSVVVIVICYILVFIGKNIFPDNEASILASNDMDFLSFIIPIYISLYIIIAFNEINGKTQCSMSDIYLIRYAGVLVFITTFIPSLLEGIYANIISNYVKNE